MDQKKRKEDPEPINIIEFHRGSDKKCKYVLREEYLKKLLEPIKDMEVVVIAVVGKKRRGKSFLLNYMSRFLADYQNTNGWMGEANKPLEGFEWKQSLDPLTFGLWLSKPFIVKKSNGKEMAVLLMDTQGLFDSIYNQRDWSTIVGISLLVSSYLIFNTWGGIYYDAWSDTLTTFNSYIDYALKAAEANAGTNGSISFQNLVFLIGEWFFPNDYKYGFSGGKQYLFEKLIIRRRHPEVAQNVRINIQKSFKDFFCFLMPPFGEVTEREDFNGTVGQLEDEFKEKLKEFISTLLNPEKLVPKMIDGNPITGEELFQQFQVFVEIFNREGFYESHEIFNEDERLILKKLGVSDKHLSELRAFIQTKHFNNPKELRELIEVTIKEMIEKFETLKKSKNTKLVDKL